MEAKSPLRADQKKVNRRVITSLLLLPMSFLALFVCAILNPPIDIFFVLIFLSALMGAALSNTAWSMIIKSGEKLRGKKLALVSLCINGLLVALVTIPLFLAEFLHFIEHLTDSNNLAARRSACFNNLKMLGLALYMYSSDNNSPYPPVDDTKNNFIFEGAALFPEYFDDASIVACPSNPDYDPNINFRLRSNEHHPDSKVRDMHPDCITDMSYVHLGWLVTSDEEAEAFFEAYDRLGPEDYDKDIVVADGKGNGGGNTIHRLRKGAESFMNDSSKTAADIPIMWDRPYTDPANFSHIPPSGNVVYLDGHVEFVKFGEKFPMTETMARLLDERPRAPIPDCEKQEGDPKS